MTFNSDGIRSPELRSLKAFFPRASYLQYLPAVYQEHIPEAQIGAMLGRFQHGITIHNYCFEVHIASVEHVPEICRWVRVSELATLPISTVLKKAKKLVNRVQSRTAGSMTKMARSGA